jgi:hypothetical protein
LIGCQADKLTDDGRQRLVCYGHLPERLASARLPRAANVCATVSAKAPSASTFRRRFCRSRAPIEESRSS